MKTTSQGHNTATGRKINIFMAFHRLSEQLVLDISDAYRSSKGRRLSFFTGSASKIVALTDD